MGCGKEIKGGWTGVFLALVTTDARMDPVRSDLCHPAGTEGIMEDNREEGSS